jgi:hypothetical protein
VDHAKDANGLDIGCATESKAVPSTALQMARRNPFAVLQSPPRSIVSKPDPGQPRFTHNQPT